MTVEIKMTSFAETFPQERMNIIIQNANGDIASGYSLGEEVGFYMGDTFYDTDEIDLHDFWWVSRNNVHFI